MFNSHQNQTSGWYSLRRSIKKTQLIFVRIILVYQKMAKPQDDGGISMAIMVLISCSTSQYHNHRFQYSPHTISCGPPWPLIFTQKIYLSPIPRHRQISGQILYLSNYFNRLWFLLYIYSTVPFQPIYRWSLLEAFLSTWTWPPTLGPASYLHRWPDSCPAVLSWIEHKIYQSPKREHHHRIRALFWSARGAIRSILWPLVGNIHSRVWSYWWCQLWSVFRAWRYLNKQVGCFYQQGLYIIDSLSITTFVITLQIFRAA